MDADVDGAISAPRAISAFDGAIGAPEDRIVTEEGFLGIMRGGDAGVATKEERYIGGTPPEFSKIHLL